MYLVCTTKCHYMHSVALLCMLIANMPFPVESWNSPKTLTRRSNCSLLKCTHVTYFLDIEQCQANCVFPKYTYLIMFERNAYSHGDVFDFHFWQFQICHIWVELPGDFSSKCQYIGLIDYAGRMLTFYIKIFERKLTLDVSIGCT